MGPWGRRLKLCRVARNYPLHRLEDALRMESAGIKPQRTFKGQRVPWKKFKARLQQMTFVF